jgi:lipase chaperone LimK
VSRAFAAIAALAAAVLLALTITWPAAEPVSGFDAAVLPAGPQRAVSTAAVAVVSRVTPMASVPIDAAAIPAPASLVGSDPDGGATLDRDGRLVPDAALRHYFDWHRAGVGELSEAEIRARLQAGLAAQLPPDQLGVAMALYDRYLEYLAASDRIPFETDPLRRLDQLRALRQMVFGDVVAAAMFEAEELALEARLLRRTIARDRTLDAAERDARLAALDAALPEELRAPAEHQQVVEAEQLSAAFEADGIAADDRFRERAALYGEAAAHRLAALDEARHDWQQRLDHFAALRARLDGDPRLPDAERVARLRRWVAEHFDPTEQRRLQALIENGLLDPGHRGADLGDPGDWPGG